MSRYQSSSRDGGSRDGGSRDGGSRSSGSQDCKVYIGKLGTNFIRKDIEDSFHEYGPLKNVWVARNPPGFAFVEFEDPHDAQHAVKYHKKRICGRDVTVEMSNGDRRERRGYGGGGGGGGGRPPPRRASRNDKCYACGDYGHFARDCPSGGRRGGGGGGGGRRYSGGYGARDRNRSRSRSRSLSRSRSRSYTPRRRDSHSKSRSRSRSRSRSHHRRSSSNDKE